MPSLITQLNPQIEHYLGLAQDYADLNSGCLKVAVGSLILNSQNRIVAMGTNVCVPNWCKTGRGCRRVELYGEDSKNHRLPSDCRAVHSEIDAIINAEGRAVSGTMYVTRYPCEACARAICVAGISTVFYGRGQEISEETQEIFSNFGVRVHWVKDWTAPDTTR
jgi:dCMP deaminase